MGNHIVRDRKDSLLDRSDISDAFRRSSTISECSAEAKKAEETEEGGASENVQHLQRSPDCEDEPIDTKFASKLKEIESEIRHTTIRGAHHVGLDKIHIGFVGFRNSGKSSLIRAILGMPETANKGTIVDRRSRFRKSKSVHFSECVNSCLVPWYFRNLSAIVLWEISYPFDAVMNIGEYRLEKREEKLRNFYNDNRLNKFCVLFLCVDEQELKDEDLHFAQVAHSHGTKVVFLLTKSDLRMEKGKGHTQEDKERFLARERILFSSKLSSIAPELADLEYFFVSYKVLPGLMRNSEDKGLVALRDIEKLPIRRIEKINEEDGSRRTKSHDALRLSSSPVNKVEEQPAEDREWEENLLEETKLLKFIVQHIDDFQVRDDEDE